jgi:Zn-finger nucleic acid-binding protein
MFISRQCEYRADAVAVRLCRDPLSLAQALRRISSGWRGGGDFYDSFESLFIISPNYSSLDEKEGFLSNLFSTHPPAIVRIGTLLNMGHSDLKSLDNSIQEVKVSRPSEVQLANIDGPRWMMVINGQWQGPFSALELMAKDLKYDTFVQRQGADKMSIVATDDILMKMFRERQAGAKGQNACPRCLKSLSTAYYEGVSIGNCLSCGGFLVDDVKTPRIIIREQQGFSDEVIRAAQLIQNNSQKVFLSPPRFQHDLACPKCGQTMVRHFYSYVYPVEVDSCYSCQVTWYDKYELEVIQHLVEKSDNG